MLQLSLIMQKILLFVIIFLVSIWFLGNVEVSAPENQEVTVSTSTPQKQVIVATSTIVKLKTATTTKSIKKSTSKAIATVSQQKPVIAPVTPTLIEPPPDFALTNTYARPAVVNILCQTKGSELSPISGTGVVISPQGVVLTNAHIGQYFLLRDFRQKDFVECVIRTGSPAYPRYHAELVYISPTWIEDNKTIVKQTEPKGTGENDFALLRITDMINGSKLPGAFPYITPNIRQIIEKNEPVILVSYPAGFLGGLSILKDLNITSSITTVQGLFTFKENSIDLISVGGTVVPQKGASGGGVVDKHATLIGLISTSSEGNTTSERDLRAITLAHINRTLQSELSVTLSQLLSQDLAKFAQTFQKTTAPILTKLITDELNKQ